MTSGAEQASPTDTRIHALDALRGLAILGMILSGQLPFGEHALPAWMYHAQVPPPEHKWIGTLPGITWVDLVFPCFIFAMGAAIPLALTRRLERSEPRWKVAGFILERWVLLGFFALFVQAARPSVLSDHPTATTWWSGLLACLLLFGVLVRLPEAWPPWRRWPIRLVGWGGALGLLAALHYPDGTGFSLGRSDIIIVVLANLALFGSFLWWATRHNWLLRLGILGLLIAIRLSNMPQPIGGWVSAIWRWSPAAWIYKLYYLQYLFILIPGTIAGDLLLARRMESAAPDPTPQWRPWRWATLIVLTVMLAVLLVMGLKARWLVTTTLVTFGLCGVGWWLVAPPAPGWGDLARKLFHGAVYWLVLGLTFEPYEGGIKKDRATLSYYFVTVGIAVCLLIAFIALLDVFEQRRRVRLLSDNGQNPMLAYAGINNLILPLLGLTGLGGLLDQMVSSPWLGFLRAAIITLLLAVVVSLFTRLKIYWRT